MADFTSAGQASADPGPADRANSDEWLAKSGLSLAQMGRLQEAREVLLNIRSKYSKGDSPRLAIRMLLLEAVAWYYEDRRPESLDRARRALALSSATNTPDLAAESAVWVSHLSFNFDEFALLSAALKISLENFFHLDLEMQGRACLIIADSNQFLGFPETAKKWYGLARIFARRAQSRTIIAAIEYNRIVMGLSRLRLERFLPIEITGNSQKDWLNELLSVRRLHEGLGVTSLKELLLLGEALAHQASNDFYSAASALSEIRVNGAARVCGLSERMLDLEIEWCKVLSSPSNSYLPSRLPVLEELEEWSFGEQVVAYKQLDGVCVALGIPIDRDRLHTLHKNAVHQCLSGDAVLKRSIESTHVYLPQIEEAANTPIKR